MDDSFLSSTSAHSIKSHSCEELSGIYSKTTLNHSFIDEEEEDILPPDAPLPQPPDGGWGWVIVLSTFFIHFIGEGIMNAFGILLINLSDSYPNYPKSVLSLIGSSGVGIAALMAPVAAALINKYGVRSITLIGGFISGICCFATFFAQTPIEIIVLFGFCTGFGQSLTLTSALVVVAQYFSKRRAFALCLSMSGMGLGSVVFPLIMNLLLSFYSWRGTMLILSGFYFNLMVFGSLLRSMETKFVSKQRRLLVRLESLSKKSGINLSEEDHYKSGSVDKRIELMKDALINPAPPTEELFLVNPDGDREQGNYLPVEDELMFLPENHPPLFHNHSFGEDSQCEDEDMQNLKFCVINIPFVREVIPLNGTYRLMLPEPSLAAIHEGEILHFNDESLLADTSSLMGKSNADCHIACLDLSNPNLFDDSLSRSKRSLQKSDEIEKLDEYEKGHDTLEKKRKKKFKNLRIWRSLDNFHLLEDTVDVPSDKSISNGDRSIFRTISDPELLRSQEYEESRYEELLNKDDNDDEIENLEDHTESFIRIRPASPHDYSNADCPLVENSPDITASELAILHGQKAKTRFKRKQNSHRQFHRDAFLNKDFPTHPDSSTANASDNPDATTSVKHYVKQSSAANDSQTTGFVSRVVSPFKRRDIFFRGSHDKLLECNRLSRALSLPNLRIPPRNNLKKKGAVCDNCSLLRSNVFIKLFKSIMDPQIFLHWPFTILIMSNILLFLWSLPVQIYLGLWSKQWGLNQETIAWIYSILGVTNTIGQILVGWLVDFRRVNTVSLYIFLILVHGVACCFLPLCQTYLTLSLFAGVFGFSIAANDSLISVIALEIVGLNKLTNGIGLVYFVQGVAFLIGPPLHGLLIDSMGQYELCFFLSGLMIVISGIILIPLVIYQACRTASNKSIHEDKSIEAHLLADMSTNQRDGQLAEEERNHNGGSTFPQQIEI